MLAPALLDALALAGQFGEVLLPTLVGSHGAGLKMCIRDRGYVNRIGDSRPYVYRPTADGEQLAGNLLDKNTFPGT